MAVCGSEHHKGMAMGYKRRQRHPIGESKGDLASAPRGRFPKEWRGWGEGIQQAGCSRIRSECDQTRIKAAPKLSVGFCEHLPLSTGASCFSSTSFGKGVWNRVPAALVFCRELFRVLLQSCCSL